MACALSNDLTSQIAEVLAPRKLWYHSKNVPLSPEITRYIFRRPIQNARNLSSFSFSSGFIYMSLSQPSMIKKQTPFLRSSVQIETMSIVL